MNVLSYKDYDPFPQVDTPRAIALGESLVSARPAAPGPFVERALALVKAKTSALESAYTPIAPTFAPSQTRPADISVDIGWGATRDALAASARLPAERYPRAERAAHILSVVLPDGLAFTQLGFAQQWAESQRRLDVLDETGLAAEVDALLGSEFLTEVRRAHDHYGQVLGITAPAPSPAALKSLQEPLRELRQAIQQYVLRLFGTLDESDPAAVAAVKAALQPLDALRAEASGPKAAPSAAPPEPVA